MPAVGPRTAIIPLLNGMRHLETLDAKFGRERVLGGLCSLAVMLNDKREVVQLAPMQSLRFGERDGGTSERVKAATEVFASGNCGAQASDDIIRDMWEKWVFLATLAGATCLMRASIGQIVTTPGGRDFILSTRDEIAGIAKAAGHAPREEILTSATGVLTAEGSPLTASMFRDIETGARVEADHIIGDLITRAEAAKLPVPKLRTIYTHLKAYENRRA
jgi:2-dehydropantoate 2-reductase